MKLINGRIEKKKFEIIFYKKQRKKKMEIPIIFPLRTFYYLLNVTIILKIIYLNSLDLTIKYK